MCQCMNVQSAKLVAARFASPAKDQDLTHVLNVVKVISVQVLRIWCINTIRDD